MPLPEIIETYVLESSDKVTLVAVGPPDHASMSCLWGLYMTAREIIQYQKKIILNAFIIFWRELFQINILSNFRKCISRHDQIIDCYQQ